MPRGSVSSKVIETRSLNFLFRDMRSCFRLAITVVPSHLLTGMPGHLFTFPAILSAAISTFVPEFNKHFQRHRG